ncbi:restriction endonuclease [Streptomyces virginiae]|uniref:restriction endonuclease n=1 Tax=Streptomyces TaxID=1883 RepID=UPI0006B06A1B|nr:restriction endonuclease [Streptomyces sp. XY533]
MQQSSARTKVINPSAYNALADALAVVFWNKPPFQRYLRGMLAKYSELVAQLDFSVTKRETSGRLVDYLRANEGRYADLTIELMIDVAEMDRFPNLEQQVDREVMIARATAAVEELRRWTNGQQTSIRDHERNAAEIIARAQRSEGDRAFAGDHDALRLRFIEMHAMADPHQRGRDFEGFINDLFRLYDMEPRASYVMEHEQVDGAFTFNTDHYVIEAKWCQGRIGRPMLDVFKANIERKGKNTLGLYVSVSGFTSDALDVYGYSTPFITMEGGDFMAVLERRIRLDDLIRRKKEHASQTGHCHLPVAAVLAGME